MKCPCCGHNATEVSLEALDFVYLTPQERRIVHTLADVYPRRLSAEQIADRVYADDPDGGPIGARKSIGVHLHRLRKKIQPMGWTAGSIAWGHGIGLSRVAHGNAKPTVSPAIHTIHRESA